MGLATIKINTTIVWLLLYLLVGGVIPALLSRFVWAPLDGGVSARLNLCSLVVVNVLFLHTLVKRHHLEIDFFHHVTIKAILMALGSVILLFLVLDRFLDPFWDRIFTTGAAEYQRTIASLRQTPVISFIHVVLLAPVVEEILMRGCVLGSLQKEYGVMTALFISSFFFAVLHFNFVQTISAFLSGLVLGLLYLNTGSLFICSLAHSLYNSITYFTCVLVAKGGRQRW